MHEETTISILKALADKTRLDIVRRLAQEAAGAPCSTVSTCSKLSQPAMSHHFHKLVEAGVIIEQKEGKEKFYALNKELLEAKGLNPGLL
jgi:ArsR family transcriptional regulator, arsenate/arsenite/antimonite-responsive transcriptional repressor